MLTLRRRREGPRGAWNAGKGLDMLFKKGQRAR